MDVGEKNITFNLESEARRFSQIMNSTLSKIYTDLDLKVPELLEVQRYFNTKNKRSVTEYWDRTPVKRAALLTISANNALDQVAAEFVDVLIEHFINTETDNDNQEQDDFFLPNTKATTQPINKDRILRCLNTVYVPVMRQSKIKLIQEQWEKLLRSQAQKNAQVDINKFNKQNPKAIILLHEISLSTSEPWTFSQRLIGAYTQSQIEIAKHAKKSKEAIKNVFAR